jgi:hypothetical protein
MMTGTKLSKYELDFLRVWDVRLNRCGTQPAHCSMERGMRNMNPVQVLLCIIESNQQQRGKSLLHNHMKILLGDFSVKVGREEIFKLTFEYDSVHENSNDNGIRVANFATFTNLTVKSTMFPT